MTMTKSILAVLIAAGSAMALHGQDIKVDTSKLPPAAAKKGVTFDTDIKPIFEKACYKCHGPEVEKPKAKFRADTRASVLKGGSEGESVVPGDISKSWLLAMISYTTEEDYFMPPKDNKAKIAPLSKEEVGLVRAWIEQGAK